MQTPSDIIDLSYNYIVVIFAGIPATILYNILSSYLRSLGDSITPVIFLIIAAVLNIGLDLFFIICLHWGVLVPHLLPFYRRRFPVCCVFS